MGILSDICTIYVIVGSNKKVEELHKYLTDKYALSCIKVSYFIDIVNRRNSNNSLSVEELGCLLVEELDKFFEHNSHLKQISLMGLGNQELTRVLKKRLQSKLVLIDTDDKYLSLASSCMESDRAISSSQTVDGLYDLNVSLNSDPFNLHIKFDALFLKKSLNSFTPKIESIESLNLPVHFKEILTSSLEMLLNQFEDKVILFSVVGSAGYQGIRDKWSDIDLLVVVDCKSLRLVRNWFQEIQTLSTIKIGVAVITPAELSLLMVEFKVTNSIYLLKTGKISAQFLRKGYELPAIEDIYRRMKNLGNVPSLIHNLRRSLIDENSNQRIILKLILRVMRNLLQFEKSTSDNIDEVIYEFHNQYSETIPIGLLNFNDIINQKVSTDKVVEMGIKFIEWYENRLLKAVK